MRYTLVDGTHGAERKDDFTAPGSPFLKTINALVPPVSEEYPYKWDTSLDGLGKENTVWMAAGANLFMYLVPPLCPDRRVKPEDLLVITFSHGAQVALYAFALGLKGRLITVNPPIRREMVEVAEVAKPNMISWLNLYGDWRDVWAVLGAALDGHLGLTRKYPEGLCNAQELVPGGHGDALRLEKHMAQWPGWLRLVGAL